MGTNSKITAQTVVAKPRSLKAKWRTESYADFRALFENDYDAWIKQVSDPDYVFGEVDVLILQNLGFEGITLEELRKDGLPIKG